jgi:aspartate carbamoyltransferase catalytic subunit
MAGSGTPWARAAESGGRGAVQHLRAIDELSVEDLLDVLDLTDHMAEVCRRPVPKVPALRGRTVLSLFMEDSTRTRLSFETAAKRLSADTMTFSASSSAVNKGESLRDTVETLDAMGIDAVVVRHRSSGVPWQVARWTSASVINAGDGWHEHPTQALLDAYTIRHEHPAARSAVAEGRRPLEGLHVGILGDIKHSRVARSDVRAFSALGAQVTLVAPSTLLPPSVRGWMSGPSEVAVVHDLDDVIPKLDVAYVLRMQLERQEQALVPTLREYTARFGLTPERAARLPGDALIMHPGPMNRGVEIAPEVADRPNAVITNQVGNGVAVRMAVLYRLLGSGVALAGAGEGASPERLGAGETGG